MNKPTYAGICAYSPRKPALVFVASRRQTRLTALELISLCAMGENPKQFLLGNEATIAAAAAQATDSSLRHTLAFGVGIHHAGLAESDRAIVEELFVGGHIQVLVCTATLAWGVNFPAHLVVVKGTEFFDAKLGRYVDYPVTDVLQMMGRAGRPQFDTHSVALILVHDPKKNFFQKFLYEPFPVESQLRPALCDHLLAEIVGGVIASRDDAVDYLTWTYYYRRLLGNPAYYGLEDTSPSGIRDFLFNVVDDALDDLKASRVLLYGSDALAARAAVVASGARGVPRRTSTSEPDVDDAIAASTLGYIASAYYLKHSTVRIFSDGLKATGGDMALLLQLLTSAAEFDELPVRHSEDELNEHLARDLPWPVAIAADGSPPDFGSPHAKAFLLLQARMTHAPLPITDYVNDTKTVMDAALRVGAALVDVAADAGLLDVALSTMRLLQCLVQARLPGESPLRQLPDVSSAAVADAILTAAAVSRPVRGAQTSQRAPVSVPQIYTQLRWLLLEAGGEGSGTPARLRSLFEAHVPRGGGGSLSILGSLPVRGFSVRAALISPERAASQTKRDLPTPNAPVVVPPGGSYRIAVALPVSDSAKAYTPFYSKGKDWGWWVVAGNRSTSDLYAIRRATAVASRSGPSAVELLMVAPQGPVTYIVTVYAICDAIVGLDAFADITVDVDASLA